MGGLSESCAEVARAGEEGVVICARCETNVVVQHNQEIVLYDECRSETTDEQEMERERTFEAYYRSRNELSMCATREYGRALARGLAEEKVEEYRQATRRTRCEHYQNGDASAAVRSLVDYAFSELNAHRVGVTIQR